MRMSNDIIPFATRPIKRRNHKASRSTVLIRDAIHEAFVRNGGVERLVAWIQEDPDHERMFYLRLLPRILPYQPKPKGEDETVERATWTVKWERPVPAPKE
jgi:hypothetical protein